MDNNDIFSRNILFWGEYTQAQLFDKNVAVFGLGGVGGFCAESLARAGVGKLTIVDFDTVSMSNINRQLVALNSTVGMKKTELFRERLLDINPDITLEIVDDFYNSEEVIIDFSKNKYDYVADAIDTMRAKIHLIESCYNNHVPIISSMGAGNRIDPSQLYISDLNDIENKKAPFVSNVIYQLKKRGISEGIPFVVSRETPFVKKRVEQIEKIKTNSGLDIEFNKITPSSTPFVASCAGIFMASYIVQSFIKDFK